jgi:proteasome lid subunit RPN8/RPN11
MIKISRQLAKEISFHGEKIYPEECCGLMLGTEMEGVRKVIKVVGLKNNQENNREVRYLITSDQFHDAEKTAREENLLLLGFYHSHPDHPAEPSQYDLEHALPWFSYIIQKVAGGHAESMTSWVLSDTRLRFNQQTLSFEE